MMKELQRTVFFAAYESAVFCSGNSVTEKEQKALLRKSILGSDDPDELTLPEQMVLGINQFSHLYENVPVAAPVNDDRNASAVADGGGLATSRSEYNKKLKDCFFPQRTTGGMLSIYANKPDGITKSLLTSKNLTNPVDVSVLTMMRGAKEVLRNGRKKALACAKDSDSEYKDGTLPSGKSIADYHRFIRERMYVCLRGANSVGDDDEADDDVLSETEDTPTSRSSTRRDDQQAFDNHQADIADADKMPEDWFFPGMLAFFLWGFIVENEEECEVYKSKQFQIGDTTRPEEKGLNSQKQVRKECARAVKKERDTGAAQPQSPFRRGATLTQQIEMAKLHAARSMEERRVLDNDYETALSNFQSEIDTRMELAKMWDVKDRGDAIFLEIRELMNQKRALTAQFQESKGLLSARRRNADAMIDGVLGGGGGGGAINAPNKRPKSSRMHSSTSSTSTTTTHGRKFSTPCASSTSSSTRTEGAPTESVSFTTTTTTTAAGAKGADGGCDGNDGIEEGDEGDDDEVPYYADCTYDLREYFQPPQPFVFPTVNDDNADE